MMIISYDSMGVSGDNDYFRLPWRCQFHTLRALFKPCACKGNDAWLAKNPRISNLQMS